ncbi:MAG: Ig-like domain-containing protein [Rhodothermales bacterium]
MKLLLLVLLTSLQTSARPDTVIVEPAVADIAVDATQQFTARAYDADDNLLEDSRVFWFSPNEEILTVDAKGLATAHRPGRTQIVAVVEGMPGYATVTVPQLPPATVAAVLPVESVLTGTSVPLEVTVRTRLGDVLPRTSARYESSHPQVASVDSEGRVYGHEPGTATITATAGSVTTHTSVLVVPNPAVSYRIGLSATGGSDGGEIRTGDVLRFSIRAETADGEEVSGLHPAWTLGPSGAQIDTEGVQGVFVAEKPGTYAVTALIGPEITRTMTVNVEPRRYNTQLKKVGRGPIGTHHSGDTWVFEGVDGRDYAYIGTFMHDWMKVWDVTAPDAPILTDSLQVDARRINDVKIHPNNRLAIITREGASNRRNGIVLLDLSTPAHPTILSEYTETVTGGVHNVWIRGDENLIYACHNGTSEMHIIDISDPEHPKEVGRWGLDKTNKVLHDVIVQDGYAYLSYWDDGVIVLDVGAGSHGGTPTEPVFVSQYKYPIGNTHVAWRYGRYLFVGDEIFPPDWDADSPIEASGYIHVIDLSDIDNPVEVARYEVPEAGAHNVWVENDRLYVGYYQGGLRVVDVSGELRGDLYRQGREMGALKTTDADTTTPNWPMTWGAQLFKGHIYTSDLNSGLWIAKFIEQVINP